MKEFLNKIKGIIANPIMAIKNGLYSILSEPGQLGRLSSKRSIGIYMVLFHSALVSYMVYYILHHKVQDVSLIKFLFIVLNILDFSFVALLMGLATFKQYTDLVSNLPGVHLKQTQNTETVLETNNNPEQGNNP